MSRTFTMPTGARVRTESKRRLVLIRTEQENGAASAEILMRSDSEVTLLKLRQQRINRYGWRANVGYFLGDTYTGEVTSLDGGPTRPHRQ